MNKKETSPVVDGKLTTEHFEKLDQKREEIKIPEDTKVVEHTIDCDTDPFVPRGLEVEEHQKVGIIEFNLNKIHFFYLKNQKRVAVEGNELRQEIKSKKALNANALDYLLENQELIPENWKRNKHGHTRFIFFWGTIYRSLRSGGLCVRFLYYRNNKWRSRYRWLDRDFGMVRPAAVWYIKQ